MNLAQTRSAVPETFHIQTKTQTDGAKNRTFRSSLCAVKTAELRRYGPGEKVRVELSRADPAFGKGVRQGPGTKVP